MKKAGNAITKENAAGTEAEEEAADAKAEGTNQSINLSIYFVICTCRHNLHKDNFNLLMYNITGTQLTFEGCNFHIGYLL